MANDGKENQGVLREGLINNGKHFADFLGRQQPETPPISLSTVYNLFDYYTAQSCSLFTA
jgi:hypothetical protein